MYDVLSVREDFPVLKEVIYLDNAATTQTPVQAVYAMQDYFFKYAANHGRGAHRLARETTNHYEDARESVASFLNMDAERTIFTKNATESINIVSRGFPWKKGDHVIVTLVEHHSNLLPWIRLKEIGVEVTVIDVDISGVVDPENIRGSIKDNTRLIAVNHVSNVFGSIQDVEGIAKIAKQAGVKILVDGSQSAGNLSIDIKSFDPDFFVCPGHKGLLGPQGTGVLYVKEPEEIEPLFLGGGMVSSVTKETFKMESSPAKFEAGTPNIPGVIGLGRSVEYVAELGVDSIQKHELDLSRKAASLLADIEGVEVYGPKKRAGVVPFNVIGMNAHDVAMILDQTKGICVRSGYHCAMPGVSSLGVNGTVRASFGLYNTEDELESLVKTVSDITALV
ncbi:cysteine desulfurase / selenocysteine lyase [Methanolobus vulcani]|jgi:cysteine desulfurase/selenocysteine lyase|uniref:cysteine desulfurase n=1 Tax=Methanolobus vulcani TaxID=38026 RepID=A0A7Z7FC61_9EURY|nr:cysteine desulfurase [Methanolobus vulcani]MDK2826007.1 cysteine desulfurase / selenocysteine lyase [Methanolobus sp.]SDF55205.1 cysteine desulfurase / selenocysteine lyase [Methanolobus vulcani]